MSSKSKKKENRGPVGESNPGRLSCYICRRIGKPTEKKFPVQVYRKENTFVKDEDGKLKVAQKPKLVGHLCLKCTRKKIRQEEAQNSAQKQNAVLSIKNYK